MKYICPLIVVKDIEKSKLFYKEVLGLRVTSDLGANVVLTGGIALQTKESWEDFINKTDADIRFGSNDAELYFEEDDFDSFINKLNNIKHIDYVHKVIEHRWGQRAVRFYDPDKHIIEIGENIKVVCKRFIDSGLAIAETATKMGVPAKYVKNYLK